MGTPLLWAWPLLLFYLDSWWQCKKRKKKKKERIFSFWSILPADNWTVNECSQYGGYVRYFLNLFQSIVLNKNFWPGINLYQYDWYSKVGDVENLQYSLKPNWFLKRYAWIAKEIESCNCSGEEYILRMGCGWPGVLSGRRETPRLWTWLCP